MWFKVLEFDWYRVEVCIYDFGYEIRSVKLGIWVKGVRYRLVYEVLFFL